MYARHDLVWLSQDGWRKALATVQECDRHFLETWQAENWPATVRRADADAAAGHISLGIALPPDMFDGSKKRIALHARIADVSRKSPPLPIAAVVAAAPPAWREPLEALNEDAAGRGITFRVYGSLALQTLIGPSYVTANSDIDLLCQPTTRAALDECLDLLQTHAQALPLDGEVMFPSGEAVAWRELQGAMQPAAETRVLVKTLDKVYLAPLSALLATLGSTRCSA